MVKVNWSFTWILVPTGHVGAEVVDELTLLLKSHQFLLVLVPNIFTIGRVECCKEQQQHHTAMNMVTICELVLLVRAIHKLHVTH